MKSEMCSHRNYHLMLFKSLQSKNSRHLTSNLFVSKILECFFTKIDKRNTHANICTNIHIEIFCEKNFEILHAISFRRIEYLLKAKYYKKPYIFNTNKYLFVLK